MSYHPFPNRKVTLVNWTRPSAQKDWEDRCQRNPKSAVFDLLIVCDNKEEAHLFLEEEYGAELAVVFPNGNKIVRFMDGRFVTVTDRPDTIVGALPTFERWNWYGKFNTAPDMAAIREKRQIDEILKITYN